MAYVGKERIKACDVSVNDINELRDIVRDIVESETLDIDTIFDMALENAHDLVEKKRIARRERARMVERIIMRNTASKIFAAGHSIEILCEGEPVSSTDRYTEITANFMADIMCSDMLEWAIYNEDGKLYGTILMILGNDGSDVIADHSNSVTRFMPTDEETATYEGMLEV